MVPERDQRNDNSRPDEQSDSTSAGNAATPAFMYVHYLPENEEDPYPVFLFQLDDSVPLETNIETAVELIRDNKVTEVRPGSLGYVEWRVFSYAVFVFNSRTQEITRVRFWHSGTSNNYAFRSISNIRHNGTYSAVCYQNERRNRRNYPLGNAEKDLVEWEVYHRHIFPAAPMDIVTHQSSDPNTGP